MIKIKKRKVFLKNLAFVFSIMLLLEFALITVMHYNAKNMVEKEIFSSEQKQNQKISTSVANYLYPLVLASASFSSANIAPWSEEGSSEYYYSGQQIAAKNMEFFIGTHNYIRGIRIKYGDAVLTSGSVSENFTAEKLTNFSNIAISYTRDDSWPHCFQIMYSDSTFLEHMIILECYSVQTSKYIISDEDSSTERMIIAEDGTIVFSRDNQQLNKNFYDFYDLNSGSTDKEFSEVTFENIRHYLTIQNVPDYNLKVVSIVNSENYNSLFYNQKKNIVLTGIVVFICFCIITYLIMTKTYAPINKILDTLRYRLLLDDTVSEDEVLFINKNINKALSDNDDLQKQLNTNIQDLHRIQIAALQSQINPHFLCNTIESLKWISLDALPINNPVEQGLVDLSAIISVSMDMKNLMIPLEEECRLTDEYIRIMKLRYGNAFDIKWSVEDGLEKVSVLKLIIQPMIENSIVHGFCNLDTTGLIKISISKTDDDVVIEVNDNGQGIEEKRLNELKASLGEKDIMMAKHIGLRNVNLRIKLLYGEKYGLVLESKPGEGAMCRLTFPYGN